MGICRYHGGTNHLIGATCSKTGMFVTATRNSLVRRRNKTLDFDGDNCKQHTSPAQLSYKTTGGGLHSWNIVDPEDLARWADPDPGKIERW